MNENCGGDYFLTTHELWTTETVQAHQSLPHQIEYGIRFCSHISKTEPGGRISAHNNRLNNRFSFYMTPFCFQTSQCVNSSQVCDKTKDCISGLDEANCSYYGSRCDGFLCTMVEQCIGIKKVCDGQKDCLDGTDETMCPGFTVHGFECRNKEGSMNAYAINEVR